MDVNTKRFSSKCSADVERICTDNGGVKFGYPVYFVTGGNLNQDIDLSLSELETIDIELSSSDDEISLSGYDVIQVNDKNEDVEKSNCYPSTSSSINPCNTPAVVATSNGVTTVPTNDDNNEIIFYLKTGERVTIRELDGIIAQWKPLLQCLICRGLCSNYTLLQEHYRREHPDKKCKVLCCGCVFSRRTTIAEHIRMNHSDRGSKVTAKKVPILNIQTEEIEAFIQHYMPSLKCPVCTVERPSFEVLKEHFRQQHPNEEECYILCCQRKLLRLYTIAEHIRVHIYADSFKCELCNKLHQTKLGLDRHMLNQHHISISVSSRNCGLTIQAVRTNSLARTRYADLNDFIAKWRPTLKCELCCRPSASVALLEMHFNDAHPTEVCFVSCCKRKLYNRHQIEEHIHLHRDPRGFKCEICDHVLYTSRSSLYSHMCMQHPLPSCNDDDTEFQDLRGELDQSMIKKIIPTRRIDKLIGEWKSHVECGECSMQYSSYTMLREHFHYKHPHEECYFSCCNLKLKSPNAISHHIRMHIYKKPATKPTNRTRRRKTYAEADEFIAQWKPNLECEVCEESYPTFTKLQEHFRYQHPREECYIVCCDTVMTRRPEIEEHILLHKSPDCFKCEFCSKCPATRKALFQHMRYQHPEKCGHLSRYYNNDFN